MIDSLNNNEPDYKDNLVFEPKMTWEELCEYVRSKATELIESGETLSMYSDVFFLINNMCFSKSGNILTNERYYIAGKKSPEQMKAIIEALWG